MKELNDHLLPPGVKVVPFLDRSDLVHYTTHTVLHNLTEGIILVAIILFLFLGNVRGAIIVALTIPFSLLFASICLDLRHIPANLLSLGALDFGMVVDGAVVMVENIVRHLGRQDVVQACRWTASARRRTKCSGRCSTRSSSSSRPTCRFSRCRAWKAVCSSPWRGPLRSRLLGALIFSMLVAPVLSSFLFREGTREWHNPLMTLLTRRYRVGVELGDAPAVGWRWRGAVASLLAAAFLLASGLIGSEFLPHLDEGAIWVRGTLAPSTGPTEGIRLANQARIAAGSFPEVTSGDQPGGTARRWHRYDRLLQYRVLSSISKPKEQWRPVFHQNKEELIAAMNRELEKIPGVIWNFSQPISDNMEEAVSGVKGELAIKVYGDDLKTLEEKGDQIVTVMRTHSRSAGPRIVSRASASPT